jgi:SAM-dependent methyltransferase
MLGSERIRLDRGRLAEGEREVLTRFVDRFDPSGARVLEIGGCMPSHAIDEARAHAWCSVDPRIPRAATEGRIMRLPAVAERLPLPSSSHDLVFSCNALQHVADLTAVLDEVARVLVPGGLLYANFGPIWTAPDGSHVEGVEVAGQRLDFWNGALLPSWAHLVLDSAELMQAAIELHGPDVGTAIAAYVQGSPWINRLGWKDYLRSFGRGPLELVELATCAELGYDYEPPSLGGALGAKLAPEHRDALLVSQFGLDPRTMRVRDLEVTLRRAPRP